MKIRRTLTALLIAGTAGFGTVGCQSDAQTGGLLGSAVGAAAGAGIDHRNRGRGALIGVGIGAVSGYIIGNESDKNKARESRINRYDY